METRSLTEDEIRILESQRCTATSWDDVRVHHKFNPAGVVTGTIFSGTVTLGVFEAHAVDPDNPFPGVGIHGARLHNAAIGDNCRIAETDIADTDVDAGCILYKTASISHAGTSHFGNGSPCHIVAEDGARAVPLWHNLSAQWAHLILHWKKSPVADRLEAIIAADAATRAGNRSRLGQGCRIRHAGTLRNIHLGPGTVIDGAERLVQCTTVSDPDAPAVIGEGVSAEDCVFLRGSATRGGTRLVHSLVGEGVILDHGFFAKHSLLFANSEFTLGEAACTMAGPFAVSHHRATLILTCQCSFNTFGSAANASNHHFKLGPRHGGMLRRGARCGSGSYLFWPCDIGAFSTVIGKHLRHLDTAAFPFSLLTTAGDESVLVPGVNLFSAGVYRDERKWPQRDRRAALSAPRDLVNPAVASPYTMQSVVQALGILQKHVAETNGQEDLIYGNTRIPAARVQPAIELYGHALIQYLGDCFARTLSARPVDRLSAVAALGDMLMNLVDSARDALQDEWRDWGGMLLSGADASRITREIADGALGSARAVDAALASAHAAYAENETLWAVAVWIARYGDISDRTMTRFFDEYHNAVHFGKKRRLRDAGKEFHSEAALGFGIEDDADASFLRVRGPLLEDETILSIENVTPLWP